MAVITLTAGDSIDVLSLKETGSNVTSRTEDSCHQHIASSSCIIPTVSKLRLNDGFNTFRDSEEVQAGKTQCGPGASHTTRQ